MNNIPDVAILKALEKQLLGTLGLLTTIKHDEDADHEYCLQLAVQQLTTTILGLRNIYQACETHPMTLGELEQAQFSKATEVIHETF